jgi:recombination protein RecT
MSTANQNANKETALAKITTLQTAINEEYVQNQLKAAMAENSTAFAASLIDLFTSDTYLQECNPKQVIMQAMKAAMLKLPINKSLGFAYIIAYAGKAEFQLGYKGLIQLAIRSNQYRHINADVVYEGQYKTKNVMTGEFDLTGTPTSDKIIGYFAYFELNNGFSKTLYMPLEKVIAHAKKYSKSYNNPKTPWTTEFDAMALKTVLKSLITHWGVLSVEMANAIDKEDVADRVQDEINTQGNSKPMHFNNVPEAEIVTNNNQQQQVKEGAPF